MELVRLLTLSRSLTTELIRIQVCKSIQIGTLMGEDLKYFHRGKQVLRTRAKYMCVCVNIMTSLFVDFISSNSLLERPSIRSINRGVELYVALDWTLDGPFFFFP